MLATSSWLTSVLNYNNIQQFIISMDKLLVVLLGYNIGDVVPWMTVESLLEPLLIHIMSNKSYAAAKHK